MAKKKVNKFFRPVTYTGWYKSQSANYRRRLVQRAFKNDILAAARSMLYLANVTTDPQTARLARADAKHFFNKHKMQKR